MGMGEVKGSGELEGGCVKVFNFSPIPVLIRSSSIQVNREATLVGYDFCN